MGTQTPITITTASDGSYSFGGLRPGTYSVAVTQPTGFLAGMDAIGTVGGTSDGKLATSTAGTITNVVLGQGSVGSAYNFGEILTTSVSGFVYADSNNNGVDNAGESGIAGVSLNYIGITDIGGVITGTTTTDSTGAYSFNNLRPGAYTVFISQPTGYLPGLPSINGSVIGGGQMNGFIGGISPKPGVAASIIISANCCRIRSPASSIPIPTTTASKTRASRRSRAPRSRSRARTTWAP